MLPVMKAVKTCPRPRKATASTIPVTAVKAISTFGSGSERAGADMHVPFRGLAQSPPDRPHLTTPYSPTPPESARPASAILPAA